MKKSSSLSELEKKNLAANKSLQQKYGITLVEYNDILEKQGGGCAICGKKPNPERRLHTDHDHKVPNLKILSWKIEDRWIAMLAPHVYAEGRYKRDALRKARQQLKKASVRGILCWPCNRALRPWNDNPDLMEKAAEYLRKYKSSFNA